MHVNLRIIRDQSVNFSKKWTWSFFEAFVINVMPKGYLYLSHRSLSRNFSDSEISYHFENFVTKANLMLESNVRKLMTSSRFNRNDWNSEFPKHFVVYAFDHWFAVEPDLHFDSYRNTHLMWYCSTNCDLIRVIYSFVYTVLCIRFES